MRVRELLRGIHDREICMIIIRGVEGGFGEWLHGDEKTMGCVFRLFQRIGIAAPAPAHNLGAWRRCSTINPTVRTFL